MRLPDPVSQEYRRQQYQAQQVHRVHRRQDFHREVVAEVGSHRHRHRHSHSQVHSLTTRAHFLVRRQRRHRRRLRSACR
jgi:hypothetical protein